MHTNLPNVVELSRESNSIDDSFVETQFYLDEKPFFFYYGDNTTLVTISGGLSCFRRELPSRPGLRVSSCQRLGPFPYVVG